jgi:hypothetical protein
MPEPMSPNPFAPPRAEVADPPSGPQPPHAVQRACRLVIASLVLGWVTLVPGIAAPAPDDVQIPFLVTLAIVAFFGALTVWLVVSVSRGASWARWALLAFLVLGWALTGLQFTDEFLRSPVSGMIEIVCTALEVAACWLLFIGSGAAWFSELAQERLGRRREGP